MKKFALLVLFTAAGLLLSNLATAADVLVGRVVPKANQVSMDQINHQTWDRLLKKYVDGQGRVDYKSWKASSDDQRALDSYLGELSRASRAAKATKHAKLAYWINAYNAVTVKGILREYPTSSIRNHTAKLFGYNIWKNLLIHVGGTKISLDSMEHEVLRKMNEPRIHFAIVCASHSCPRLLNAAYTAQLLEQQLTVNTKDFFANPGNFKFDSRKKTFGLSSILKWFASDFGNGQAAQLKTISEYLPTDEARTAARNNVVRVSYLKYDWSLNEKK